MRVFHGTAGANLESILKCGILRNPEQRNWECSENSVYFFGMNWYVNELDGSPDDEEDEIECRLREVAKEQATVSLLFKRADYRAVVLVCDIDESELNSDYSCPNMDNAYCVNRDIRPEEILEVWTTPDLSWFMPCFIGSAYNRLNSSYNVISCRPKWTSEEWKIAQVFAKQDWLTLWDCFYEMELDRIQ